MKTFRAADGRRVRERVSEEQRAERELFRMVTALTPILMILVFALAGRMV